MRPTRSLPARFAPLLLALAAGSLHAQPVLATLGTSTGCGNLTSGQSCTLTARVTGLANASVSWSFTPNVSGVTLGTPVGPDPTGQTSRTYTAPNIVTAKQTVTATVTASDNVTKASALITLVPPTVTVLVSPSNVTLTGGQSQSFTATVFGTSSTGVTWSISPQVGSIDGLGNYTAPATISTSQKVTVTALSTFDNVTSGSATVNLSAPAAVAVSISPTSVALANGQTQQFTATVTNATNTAVLWSVSPSTGAGTIDNNGNYTAPDPVTVTKAAITATSVQDSTKTATATVTLSNTIGVGNGAPTPAMVAQFLGAYTRGSFASLTALPPLGQVKGLGSFNPPAYVQEFPDAAKTSGVKYALATGSPTTTGVDSTGTLITIYQIWSDVYAYYTSLGVGTVGLPLSDTQTCPFPPSGNTCTFQGFDKNYMLFVYSNALAGGTNFFIRNASATATFYNEWNKLGGIGGPGMPLTGETTITSGVTVAPATTANIATMQTYSQGAIFATTSGPAKGTTYGVTEPFYDAYLAAGGPSGKYGFPIGDVEVFSSGLSQQRFEGGILQMQPGSGGPTGQLPVSAVTISGASTAASVTLALGATLTLTASPYDSSGNLLVDRPVTWATSNGLVIQIQPNGHTAVVTAAGSGTASVTASSGGVTSAKVTFLVTSPCCQVGDGAPAPVQTAFQTAIARNKLSIQLPVPTPAQRVGSGYVQMLQGAGNPPLAYMLAQADQAGSAYLVTGALLAAYQSFNGPAGPLGYPTGDASAGGTQLFSFGQALAGNPVHIVSVPILTKWAQLKYESGAAGVPAGDASSFSTFGANSGVTQNFAGGAIYSATAGPLSGQSYFVSGLILTAYNAGGGASGDFGMPKSDEFVTGGIHQQNFEGGSISYTPGASAAQPQLAPKKPAVIVAPGTISAGGNALLAVAGFPNGSTVQVSVTGQASFQVTSATGAYSWQMHIPLNTASLTLSIHASDASGNSADGALAIRGFADNRVLLTKIAGDGQTAPPGATLPIPLQVSLADASGIPVSGATVFFQAYPGVLLSTSSALTDANGRAVVSVRLPVSAGTVGVTASAPNMAQGPVTFYASAAATKLSNFPSLQQSGSAVIGSGSATIAQKGALLAAVAGILQYRQNRSEVPSPNGAATAAALNQFLTADCAVDASGKPICDGFLANSSSGEQVVNLWRAADFTGGLDVVAVAPTSDAVTDILSQGEPVLLSLSLSLNGTVAGGHFVVATGINSDGSIAIQDPSPLFARTNLGDYVSGFSAASGAWKATVVGAVRFALRSPGGRRFLMGAVSQPASVISNLALSAISTTGVCGVPVQMLDTVDASGNPPATGALVSQFTVCDGLQPTYQITAGASQAFRAFVTDLAKGGTSIDISGNSVASYQASRPVLNLVLTPLATSFSASAVVNAATFAAGIAPGGLFSIFGSGLSGPGTATTVDFDGVSATVMAATPFQINAMVPPTVTPGAHVLRVQSAFGVTQQTVTVSAVSPGIFLIGDPPTGAVENSGDYSVNTSSNPAARGQALIIYATGLGTLNQGIADATVTAVLNGVEMPVQYAGAAPGWPGLNQVNVVLPASMPPGLGLSLMLKVSGQASNTVYVSIR